MHMYSRTAHRLLRGGDRLLLRLDDMMRYNLRLTYNQSTEAESDSGHVRQRFHVVTRAWGQRLVPWPARRAELAS